MRDISDLNTEGMTNVQIDCLKQALERDNQRIEYGHRNDGWIIAGVVAFIGLWLVLAFLRYM